MFKRALRWVATALFVLLLAAGGFVYAQASAFDASLDKVYAVTSPAIVASTDPAVIARGKHLSESLGGCDSCHGSDLGGKPGEAMGPLGLLHYPNLTRGKGGVGARYSDGELARLVRHGIKANGKGIRFMPSQDMHWWPEQDLVAIVSYVRSVPNVDRTLPDDSHIGVLGKLLDRLDQLPLDVARRIDHHAPPPKVPAPAPTAAYGKYLAMPCSGCHGPGLSGGKIPGAPPDLPVPTNITPHATGIKHYTEADFMKLVNTGIKPNGKKLDPFMPLPTLTAMNDVEKKALWAYLSTLPPKPFGGR
jgi:mono/diheme cytochrome c family protein